MTKIIFLDWQKEIPGQHLCTRFSEQPVESGAERQRSVGLSLQGKDGIDQLWVEYLEKLLLCVWNLWKKTALGT